MERKEGEEMEVREELKGKEVAEPSRETQIAIAAMASSSFPGFRFSPTDVELISHYLKKKMDGCEKCVEVIPEVEICRYEPWDLPAKSIIQSDNEWFFFSARGRKYPNGSQSKRATDLGYWKATGKERNVKSGSSIIGTKRTLVFHLGRAPRGERTEWIMHEYCMYEKPQDTPVICRLRRNTEFRPSDASKRSTASQGQGTAVGNSNDAVSEGGAGRMCVSEGDEAIMGDQTMGTSSSYDSHSVEQLHSTSESIPKLLGEPAQAESSVHQKDTDKDEDFYADILKDDIIKLDESVMSSSPKVLKIEKSSIEAEGQSHQSMQPFLAPVPIPCIAKFNEHNMEEQPPGRSSISSAMGSLGIDNSSKEYNVGKDKDSDWWPKRFTSSLVSMGFSGKTSRQRVAAIMVVLFLVMLAVLMMGSSRK